MRDTSCAVCRSFLLFVFLTPILNGFSTVSSSAENNSDRFNYRETVGDDYGPKDWNKVTCSDVGNCQGWPDGWKLGVGWELGNMENNCRWCPADGNNNHACGPHHQSPIDLLRTNAVTGHDPECYDFHWIAYEDGACKWNHMIKNGYTDPRHSFRINRHGLQILMPIDETTGELQCEGFTTGRKFPRLDYPKGFPDWWYLSHTDITMPSEHTQAGKRYAAEVHLSHFYSVPHETRQVGKVAIFLEVGDAAHHKTRRWGFLDKLICQWREVEEIIRQDCGLESAPPYPGCRNPVRQKEEVVPPEADPYPFIDCDTIENYSRICKPTSCCEAERSTTDFCVNDIYGRYGDDMVGSICWWCCPHKLLGREKTTAPTTSSLSTSFVPSTDIPTRSDPITSSPLASLPPTMGVGPIAQSPPNSLEPSTKVPRVTPSLSPSLPADDQPFDCELHDGIPGINMKRICKDDGCCDPARSATDHCHYAYAFFGVLMADVCSQCCRPSKRVGPPPPLHPTYPKIDCSLEDNPFRMCKPGSCCDPVRSESQYCAQSYQDYGEFMGSICWYCCSDPKEVDPSILPPSTLLYPLPTANPSNSETPTELLGQFSTVPTSIPTTTASFTSGPTSMSTRISQPTPLMSTNVPTLPPAISSSIPTPNSELSYHPTQGPFVIHAFQCSEHDETKGIEIRRICKDGGCCDPIRSSTDHCHRIYKFFGDSMDGVCSGCCQKKFAPPPPTHPVYPPIDCTLVSNPFRICKPTSCCNKEHSKTLYCRDVYESYGDAMGSICWYCCSLPKEVDPTIVRRLELDGHHEKLAHFDKTDDEIRTGDILLPHGLWSKHLRMDDSNFETAEDLQQRHQANIEDYRKWRDKENEEKTEGSLRKLQNDREIYRESGDNYINVRYSPYEWMREVRTEYFFRYEGAQMVPPCFETVHYRVMKDPIRIHAIQLQELERLVAWRIAPKGSVHNECQRDTAGRERPGSNGNAVDMNRPLQEYSNVHRKVFCECIDWNSKFDEDVKCCQLDEKTRFFDRPYNFS